MMPFDLLKKPDINQWIKEYNMLQDTILLDVRTPQEYRNGHIPGSRNVPLLEISRINTMAAGKDTPFFVYCHSGARSRRAVELLTQMGYTNTKNIGGIAAYTGKVEH